MKTAVETISDFCEGYAVNVEASQDGDTLTQTYTRIIGEGQPAPQFTTLEVVTVGGETTATES